MQLQSVFKVLGTFEIKRVQLNPKFKAKIHNNLNGSGRKDPELAGSTNCDSRDFNVYLVNNYTTTSIITDFGSNVPVSVIVISQQTFYSSCDTSKPTNLDGVLFSPSQINTNTYTDYLTYLRVIEGSVACVCVLY